MHAYTIKLIGERIRYRCHVLAADRGAATQIAMNALPAGFVLRAIVCMGVLK